MVLDNTHNNKDGDNNRTTRHLSSMIQLEPCFREAIEKGEEDFPPDFILTPEALRDIFISSSKNPEWIQQLPPVIEQTWSIPNRNGVDRDDNDTNGSSIQLTMTRPLNTELEILPVIIYLHGGGFVLGNEVTHSRPRTELAVAAHAAVIFVHYNLAPEKKYPIALEECYNAILWAADETNAQSIFVDPSKLALVGDSSGANLVAAITILAKQRQQDHCPSFMDNIQGQILFYPAVDTNFETDSYIQFAKGYDLTRELMQWFWDHYLPSNNDDGDDIRQKSTIAPLKASLEELRDLPPALIITCEADVLRDEGEAYARKLLMAGVNVTAIRMLGTIHGFLDMPFFPCRAARTALDLAVVALDRFWKKK
ncbi:alpha/beta hydrolase fold-domain-containing protein [Phascolomyces articulosus]|uniref:Alpha/beta hydrolase fold-domain-containing protein n=1 Tax=Phascolomyces articulosus TaxID=60185 RepID=A0AAD5KGH7_9FUNG|nr:alpha/beta hydrolase fold-domain-containing protein [Phascolomyces articulosus]